MGGLGDAVKNGPAIKGAEAARIQARIELAEQRAKTASSQASEYRRKAGKDGPMAWYWRQVAQGMDTVTAQRRHEANKLRTDLAKAKADEAAKEAKRVKRTVASTAASGLVTKTPGQPGQSGRAKAGQVAKPGGQAKPTNPNVASPAAQPKGRPMTAVSGEAVNVEQTRAVIDQLRSQVTDTRGAFEGASGSLASGGLGKLAGPLSSADDALDSVLSSLDEADRYLSDQEAIAEAAQAAGEMHADTSFYG